MFIKKKLTFPIHLRTKVLPVEYSFATLLILVFPVCDMYQLCSYPTLVFLVNLSLLMLTTKSFRRGFGGKDGSKRGRMDRHITGGNGLGSQGAPGENGSQNCLSKGTNIQMNLISILWLVSTDNCLMYQSLAVDIETESKDSHRLLGGLGDDMDGSRCFFFYCDTKEQQYCDT